MHFCILQNLETMSIVLESDPKLVFEEASHSPAPITEMVGKTQVYTFNTLDDLDECLLAKTFILKGVASNDIDKEGHQFITADLLGRTRNGPLGIFRYGAKRRVLNNDPEQFQKKGTTLLFYQFAQMNDPEYIKRVSSGEWDDIQKYRTLKKFVNAIIQDVAKEYSIHVTPMDEYRIKLTSKNTEEKELQEDGTYKILSTGNKLISKQLEPGRFLIQPKKIFFFKSNVSDGFVASMQSEIANKKLLTDKETARKEILAHNEKVLKDRKRKQEEAMLPDADTSECISERKPLPAWKRAANAKKAIVVVGDELPEKLEEDEVAVAPAVVSEDEELPERLEV